MCGAWGRGGPWEQPSAGASASGWLGGPAGHRVQTQMGPWGLPFPVRVREDSPRPARKSVPMPLTTATSRPPLDLSRLLGCDRSGTLMTHDSAAAPPPVVPSSSPLPGVIWSVQTGLHRQEGLLSVLTWAWRLKADGAYGGHREPQSFPWVLPSEGSSYLCTVRFPAHTGDLSSAM